MRLYVLCDMWQIADFDELHILADSGINITAINKVLLKKPAGDAIKLRRPL
jgi:hypothetical protein